MAVNLGAMRFIKPAVLHSQVFQLGGTMTFLFPVDFSERAAPWNLRKPGQARLAKRTVKASVVGNHQIGIRQQGGNSGFIQALALHHHTGDAGDFFNFRGNRHAWVFQAVVHRDRPNRQSGGGVHINPQHGQLNDFVAGLV